MESIIKKNSNKKPMLRKIKIIEEEEHNPFAEFFVENDENKNKKIEEYLSTKSPMEIKAMKIAKEHLKSSFHIFKSNDYINWGK